MTRSIRLAICLLLFAGSFNFPAQSERRMNPTAQPARKPNVLFIAVDDLRPLIGAYGAPVIQTPNIDVLARRGAIFTRAYCQQALCSPSRTSLLTGLRPDTTRVYNLGTHFRATIPDVVTLPQYFKQHGYHSQSFGKIYHGGMDDAASWSAPSFSSGVHREGRQARRDEAESNTDARGPSWVALDVADNELVDGQVADKAIETIARVKDKPFFIAVGFRKPHLPFIAPKKYYDLYPLEKMRLAPNPFTPKDVPQLALTNSGELRAYSDIPKSGPIPDQKAREVIRGYYAATSYTDAQIGRVIKALDQMGLRDNTIIVLWGDHGWQLGEHGLWAKHTNFELATRAPLILSAPGQKESGMKLDALVEFVDIYPTLCELAGLPVPDGLEGVSLAPLLKDPKQTWKRAAFSQYPRSGKIMGYSVRTDRYRYTEWAAPGQPPTGIELYDHQTDREENENLAYRPEHKKLVAELSRMLHDGWRAALP